MIILSDSCPICNSKNIEVKNIEYDFPKIGKAILYVFKCNDCGYKTSEIIPLEERQPVSFSIKVDSKEKFGKLILKSPYAKLILKEIDLEILPGIESKFEIKAVDDLLMNIKDKLDDIKVLYINEPEKYNKIVEKINYLNDVLNNKKEITIIIEDEKGYSMTY
ncbi:MAG: ZPR1 zinc finger domain-containing protein [Nanopusillaceae archaeon]